MARELSSSVDFESLFEPLVGKAIDALNDLYKEVDRARNSTSNDAVAADLDKRALRPIWKVAGEIGKIRRVF